MVEKKKGKKRKEQYTSPGDEVIEKPCKDEYTVGKWLRKNVPIKKTKFLNHVVEYFTASRAVEALLESKFAKGDNALFTTKEDIVDYMQVMLEHKFFHRARKIPVSEQELKAKKKDKKIVDSGDEKKKDKDDKEKKKDKNTDAENSMVEGKPEDVTDKEKRKRKIRLDMHNDQRFVDGFDAYVWIYDPIPLHYWIIGSLLVLGAIGICLFPLWPPSVRLGVYYLSVAAAGFLVFIILLVVLRLFVFCCVWVLTMGKHHIWILPNLTEDVGFFASFWPLYKYEYKGENQVENGKDDDSTIMKKKKKDKDSDAEEEIETEKIEDVSPNGEKIKTSTIDDVRQTTTKGAGSQAEQQGASESESETSQRSSTGKDFEIVDKDDFES